MGSDSVSDKVTNDAQKFDWVTQRSACSLPKIFKDLKLRVDEDVKTRNALRPENSPYEFSTSDKGNDFTVLLTAKEARRSIVFSLGERAIVVRDDQGSQMFDVTLTFSKDDHCKLRVKDEDRELWQVRRMALEDLMFRGY